MTRILSTLLLILSAAVAAAETHVGQVRYMNRPEGMVIAVDDTGDGVIDHLFIAAPVRIAGAFSGHATVNSGETYLQVIPADGTSGLQYHIGKEAPTYPSQKGYRGMSVHGIAYYTGKVVAYPLAELGTLPLTPVIEEKQDDESVNLSVMPSLEGDDRGLYVGQIRILPRAGHFVIAVDDSKGDGIVDKLLVVETTRTVEAWSGRALVEVTQDAGLRVVDLDKHMRQVLAFKPSVIQARSGEVVAVPMADVENMEIETPSETRLRRLREMYGNEAPEFLEKITACPGGPITEPCYPDPPPDPPGGGGVRGKKCSQPCLRGRCEITCYEGTPVCTCSGAPTPGWPLCYCAG